MRSLRRLATVVAVLGALWWVSSRWWRARSDPSLLPEPATPWPPVPIPPAGAPAVSPPRRPSRLDTTFEVTATISATTERLALERGTAAVDGSCPEGYPVKAKRRSRLYHEPGMAAYDRTTPDRCYRDGAEAEADGFRRAKY